MQLNRTKLFIAVFALIGAITAFRIFASINVTSFESEDSVLTGEVTSVDSADASGGKYTQFGDDPKIEPDLLSVSFDSMPLRNYGQISNNDFANFGEYSAPFASAASELAIVTDSEEGRVLEARYVPASNGSARIVAQWGLASEHREVYLSYKLKFMPGWEYVKGGKLPGLAGGSAPSGGTAVDNGMSARMKWRANADGSKEQMSVYLYWLNQPNSSVGEDLKSGYRPPTGDWVTITQRINLGTPGNADGQVQVWFDGVEKINRTDMQFLTSSASWKIDQLMFSSFYGGNDWASAPSKTTYARFADFKAATTIQGVDKP